MHHQIHLAPTPFAQKRRLVELIANGDITLGGYVKNKIYGTLNCGSGKRMKATNRIFFKDEREAQKAGFRPCAHCLPERYAEWKRLTNIKTNHEKITNQDWDALSESLHQKGYAIVKNLITTDECGELIDNYNSDLYRKTVVMERYRFGLGEYKYYEYPLPQLIANIRRTVYPYLAKVANQWMQALHIDKSYPFSHAELLEQCHAARQTKPTVLILKYGAGGFNTLHQDLYGDIYFPMQVVLFLNQAGKDHTGGEFVLTEQIPRAQSKVIVLQPNQGDMLIFTTNFRPVKGSKGYYRVNMKHGISEVHTGERHTLGIIFHDALS